MRNGQLKETLFFGFLLGVVVVLSGCSNKNKNRFPAQNSSLSASGLANGAINGNSLGFVDVTNVHLMYSSALSLQKGRAVKIAASNAFGRLANNAYEINQMQSPSSILALQQMAFSACNDAMSEDLARSANQRLFLPASLQNFNSPISSVDQKSIFSALYLALTGQIASLDQLQLIQTAYNTGLSSGVSGTPPVQSGLNLACSLIAMSPAAITF